VPTNGRTIVNSDQILDLPKLPQHADRVWAVVRHRRRVHLHVRRGSAFALPLIEKRPKLLEFADQEIVEALSYHLRDSRVTMRLHEEVESVEELPDCSVVANLEQQKKEFPGAPCCMQSAAPAMSPNSTWLGWASEA